MKRNRKIIYIISAGHSGSTFLTKLLGQQKEIFSGSELVNYTNKSVNSGKSYCSCGKPYKYCPFWSEIAKKNDIDNLHLFSVLKKTKSGKDFIKLFFTVLFNRKFDSNKLNGNIEDYNNLYDSIFELNNCHVIIDASKNFFNALILSSQKKYDSSFIFLKRDGRAVLSSYMKSHYFVELNGRKTKNERNKFEEKKVVQFWIKQNVLGLLLILFRFRKTISVKHENLISNTNNELKRLSKAFTIDLNRNIVKFKCEDHMFEGNSSRMNTNEIKKIDLFKWKYTLSDDQLKKFNWNAKILNIILGYKI